MRWLRPLLLLLLAGCASGAASDAALQAAADAEIARRPAHYRHGEARAWLIAKDGNPRGLLWGTMHIAYSGATVMPRPIRARFYGAADLSVETVIDRLPRGEARRLRDLYRKADERPDPAAIDRLDPSTRQALHQAVQPDDTRAYSLRGLAMIVAARAAANPADALPVVGFVDLNLIAFARSQDRPVLGLEPPQTPDPTLQDPNGPDAARMLSLDLRRAPTIRPMGEWVRDAYGRGDLAHAVAALTAWQANPDDEAFSDHYRQALLTARNLSWIPRLQTILATPGQHFIAVGAGHLLGDDGLVALLRTAGYTVTPCLHDLCS